MLARTALSLLLAATALAQGPTDPRLAKFIIEPGSLEISDLIDQAATYLGWNILVNPQEIQGCNGQFKLQNRVEVDRPGCEEVLTTLLSTRGIVLRTLDEPKGLYEVLALNGPRSGEAMNSAMQRSPAEILARPQLRMPVSTVLPLEHINSAVATNALRPFFGARGGQASVSFGSIGSDSALLMTGMQDQVANAVRLIQLADVAKAAESAKPDVETRLEDLARRIGQLEDRIERIVERAGK
ncbi:MAG: hypothetical protein KDE27_20155 [Planctomycetes bacterium]|nr:hypothetical protein [Planctomycetota bacterium]